MRRYSPSRERQEREDRPTLSAFAEDNPFCWRCGKTYTVQTHHIAGRTHRRRHARANLCRLCRRCHDAFHDNRAGLLEALALKQLFDPVYYDRILVLEIRGRSPSFIAEWEIEEECQRIQARLAG